MILVNTTATLFIPTSSQNPVLESGRSAALSSGVLPTGAAPNPQLLLEGKPLAPETGTELGVHSIQHTAGSIEFQLDPGHYQFTVQGL